MITVLSGENDYMRLAELAKLKSQFIEHYGEFGLETISAGRIEFGRLLETVSSLPFLASRRLIILEDVTQNKAIIDKIDELLEATAETTDLIINQPKIDKRSLFYKTLKTKTQYEEFQNISPNQLPGWLVEQANKNGGQLTINDAMYFIQRVGTNQLTLINELEKLLIYDPKITRATIDLLTEQIPEGSIFDLIDAAFKGQKDRAVRLYKDQRSQGMEPQAIMALIAWQVHLLCVVKANQTLGPEQIAAQAKLSPFAVKKTFNIAAKLRQGEVRQLLERVIDLDLRLKSQNIDADEAVELLLINL